MHSAPCQRGMSQAASIQTTPLDCKPLDLVPPESLAQPRVARYNLNITSRWANQIMHEDAESPTNPAPASFHSRTERIQAGKQLRNEVPRESHAAWQPPANRRDPI